MSDYDNRGQVALWNNASDNPKAPILRGTFIAHKDISEGEEVEIALWRNESDNPKAPTLKGEGKDKRERQSEPPGRLPGGEDEDWGSDIPF
jgi:hypothetical protein